MNGVLPVKMSVVLVAYRDSENLRSVLGGLNAQTAASGLECIIVTPSKAEMDWVPPLLQNTRWRLVEIPSINSAGTAKAAGVAAAGAPLVSFLEDHSRPDPLWAESLIRAHENGNFAAVAPVVVNGNPGTAASWGCFLVYYGQYMWAKPQDQLKHLPANHSCYRRDLLLEYGHRLPDLLEAEIMLHHDLLARGYRLFQEPSARAYHLNDSRLRLAWEEYFWASRVFAAERASGWGAVRRITYAVGSPLLPLIRIPRILNDSRHAGLQRRVLTRAIPAVLSTLAAGAVGELAGYAGGAGPAKERLQRFESRRGRVLSLPGGLTGRDESDTRRKQRLRV